jgi:RNA polymerase sigma-70 factor (family 1)
MSEISYDEKRLLLQVTEGDEQAFRQIYDQYRKRIYSYALNLTESDDKACEVVQEVFLKLWINRTRLPHVNNFQAWLFAIARNAFFDAIKRTANESSAIKKLSLSTEDSGYETEDILLYKEDQELLKKAIDQLSEQQKLVFNLKSQGLRLDEIARELNLSKNTIKVHLARSIASLKEYLKNHTDTTLILLLILMGRQ